jgi:hypothetical protein
MGRQERRERTALDEAYRYFRQLDSGEQAPDIFRLNKAVKTLSFALAVSDISEFKLTKQLWKRLHQALFDKLISNFSGRLVIWDEDRNACEIRNPLPESGYLEFYADRCKRTDDIVDIELSKLYPKTQKVIKHVWETRGAFIKPSDFEGQDCDGGVCFMKPMVLGQEVLGEESSRGRADAHNRWWELYWQAYCAPNKHDQELLTRQMNDLESLWGNLYY